MKKLIDHYKKHLKSVRTWLGEVRSDIPDFLDFIADGMSRIERNIIRLMIIGFLLNLVSIHLFPDFPERFPAIYGWFNGWLQFGEFVLETAFGGIYSLFTGNWDQFSADSAAALNELWGQFTNWLRQFTL